MVYGEEVNDGEEEEKEFEMDLGRDLVLLGKASSRLYYSF